MSHLLFNITALAGQILVLFALYGVIDAYLPTSKRPSFNLAAKSILFSLVGVYSLFAPIELMDGVIADPRGAILACATLFGGRWVGLITSLSMIAFRLVLGGAGAWAGALGLAAEYVCLLALLQPALAPWLPRQSYPMLVAGALAMTLLEPLSLLLIPPPELGRQLFAEIGPSLGLLQLIATLLLGTLLKFQNERARLIAELRAHQIAFDNAQEAVMITDAEGHLRTVNKAFTDITGFPPGEILGKPLTTLADVNRQSAAFWRKLWETMVIHGGWRGEVWQRRRDGETYPVWLSLSGVRDDSGNLTQCVGVFTDITSIKHYQTQLEHLAHHDPLTGLANRLLLCSRLEHAIHAAERNQEIMALFFIDLDRFKGINDSLGHALGDEVLKCVASRLQATVRKEDTPARLGGDEFVVLAERLHNREEAVLLAHRLLKAMAPPMRLGPHQVYLSASIGISIHPHDGHTVDALLQHADAAMFRAKEKGRHNYQFYTEDMAASLLVEPGPEPVAHHHPGA